MREHESLIIQEDSWENVFTLPMFEVNQKKKKRRKSSFFNCPCVPFGLGFLYPFTILTVIISLVKNKTQDNIMDDQLVCMGYQCLKHFFKQKKKSLKHVARSFGFKDFYLKFARLSSLYAFLLPITI